MQYTQVQYERPLSIGVTGKVASCVWRTIDTAAAVAEVPYPSKYSAQ